MIASYELHLTARRARSRLMGNLIAAGVEAAVAIARRIREAAALRLTRRPGRTAPA